jgi:microsomal dipeptidase-like Zn-dependent dipeptidase
VPTEEAARVADELATVLERLGLPLARRIGDFEPGRVTAVMHLEGAEPLATDLSDLNAWYERGLRSLGIVWSRPNAFAEGVPFRFPSSPDTGRGLTPAGRRLVRACNWAGIMIDVSHLNEAGFWDVARASNAPLVASHSNAHWLCPSSRNLTDEQLDAIGASDGLVGINFANAFLRPDGRPDGDTPLELIVAHVAHVARRIGVEHVAFGSDFEGATIPDALGGVAGLPRLVDTLREHGFGEDDVAAVTHGNWLRVLDRTWAPWRSHPTWADFEPRATLLDAIARFDAPGFAVDVGCGSGRDTLELLRSGWRVLALDREPEAIERVVAEADGDGRLTTEVARVEDATWPACDLVNASFSLPFCAPSRFDEVWARIVDSLRPGGRFSGQLFGDRDEWAGTGITTVTADRVAELLRPFAVESLEEAERDGTLPGGRAKHWHVFHVVARKR